MGRNVAGAACVPQEAVTLRRRVSSNPMSWDDWVTVVSEIRSFSGFEQRPISHLAYEQRSAARRSPPLPCEALLARIWR
jgi:hypothetical protein